MKLTPLTPITSELKTYDLVALDTEGDGSEGGYIIGVCYDADGPHIFRDRRQLKDWLFSRSTLGKRIVAANLEYDYAVAFQPFNGHFDILLSNRRWMQAVYRDGFKHAWTAFDIQRVAPLSVHEMGEVIGLKKFSTPPALIHDARYHADEWKCQAHARTFCVECYCVRDAEITYKFAVMYQRALNGLGAEMKLTAASTAMNLFRRRFLMMEVPPTLPERNEMARSAYFGGRVEVYRIGTSFDVHAYDFNSLYPSVMRDAEVGRPDTYRRVDRPANPYRYLDYFGQFWGSLRLPRQNCGLLPFRFEGRLYFPTGDVSGSWMLSEVRNALKHGATIRHTDAILYARQTLRPFAGYIETLYRLRSALQETSSPEQITVKLLMNALYGKFAQHDGDGLQTLIAPPPDYDLAKYAGDEPVIIAGREMFIRSKQTFIQPPHIQVLWAAEITAQARIKLLSTMLELENEVVYCDTDSIHTGRTLPIDPSLGKLKLEHDLARVTYFAPKEYGGQDKSGEFIQRAKGVPISYRSEYLTKGAVEFQQPIHVMTAVRRGRRIAEWVNVEKHRRSDAMNRKHAHLSDYNKGYLLTEPFEGGEL